MKKKYFVPFGIAGFSVGAGLVGQAINSSGLTSAASNANSFVAPATSIVMGSTVINMAKDLKTKKKKRYL